MKINKLKINSYGKLKNKEINLDKKINIIYGKNESGKSTLIKFIINSFYGISKNKKGKEYSDLEKYTPWVGDDFSGKLEYELDNNKKFEIYREFKKKNPKIFNENMEDISKEFNIDKNKGNEFFYEQTKIDEDLFLSTIVINQKEVELEKSEQNFLIQKIANLIGTGDDTVSFKKSIDRINRRQLNEVGTERSREKPLNVVEEKIYNLEAEKAKLEKYENIKYDIEDEKNKINLEINCLENKNNLLKEIKILNENEKIEIEKIKIKENMKNNNLQEINLLKNNYEKFKDEENKINNEKIKNNEKNKNKLKKIKIKLIIIFLLIIFINILQVFFIKNNYFKYIFLLTVPAVLIFEYFYFKNKKNKLNNLEYNFKNNLHELNLEKNNLKNQINLLEKNDNEIINELNNLKNNFNLKINIEKEKIKNKYLNKIEKEEINNLFNIQNINFEIENIQNEINNKKIKLHTLELDKKNIEPRIENLARIEEELVYNKAQKMELEKLESSMELAKNILSKCYEKMKNSVAPKFTQNLSQNIKIITGGKYTKVTFNDDIGLIVELENGEYVSASKLSLGTVEQLYLSLRLSILEEMSEEKMPIMLDETFAYFDEERLFNILNFLFKCSDDRQIIIFTCTNREINILNKLNIKYNLINL